MDITVGMAYDDCFYYGDNYRNRSIDDYFSEARRQFNALVTASDPSGKDLFIFILPEFYFIKKAVCRRNDGQYRWEDKEKRNRIALRAYFSPDEKDDLMFNIADLSSNAGGAQNVLVVAGTIMWEDDNVYKIISRRHLLSKKYYHYGKVMNTCFMAYNGITLGVYDKHNLCGGIGAQDLALGYSADMAQFRGTPNIYTLNNNNLSIGIQICAEYGTIVLSRGVDLHIVVANTRTVSDGVPKLNDNGYALFCSACSKVGLIGTSSVYGKGHYNKSIKPDAKTDGSRLCYWHLTIP